MDEGYPPARADRRDPRARAGRVPRPLERPGVREGLDLGPRRRHDPRRGAVRGRGPIREGIRGGRRWRDHRRGLLRGRSRPAHRPSRRRRAGGASGPADRAVVAGSWMEPASVSPEAGVVFRSDGTSARFQSLRRSAASEQAAPASYCADPARAGADARHWVWDGARALELQGEPGVPGPAVLPPRAPRWRAVNAVPYRLVTGADEELQAGLWS